MSPGSPARRTPAQRGATKPRNPRLSPFAPGEVPEPENTRAIMVKAILSGRFVHHLVGKPAPPFRDDAFTPRLWLSGRSALVLPSVPALRRRRTPATRSA